MVQPIKLVPAVPESCAGASSGPGFPSSLLMVEEKQWTMAQVWVPAIHTGDGEVAPGFTLASC